MLQKLPVGIQTFSDIREDNYLYIILPQKKQTTFSKSLFQKS